jgi:very-short-patch-repair endonuclease
VVIAGIAARQHGIVTRSQLLDAGLSSDDISYRMRVGRLIAVHRGVYAVGHLPPSPHAKSMAAVLACGPHAVLSHRSAGALYGLVAHHGRPELTAPTNHSHRGIDLHRSKSVDRTVHYGIPVTTPARTLLDLAAVLDYTSLTRAVNEAHFKNLLTFDSLAAVIATARGRHTRPLRNVLSQPPTRSHLERAFLAMLDRHGLPRPEVNATVHGYEVDMLWRRERLIAELDGRQHLLAFERDRERDADLLAHGLRTIRITWRRLTTTPAREAERIEHLLGLAGEPKD